MAVGKCKKPTVLVGAQLRPKERDKCKEKVSCKVAQSGNTSLAPKAPLLPSGTELSYPAQPRAPPTTPSGRLGYIYGKARVCARVGLEFASSAMRINLLLFVVYFHSTELFVTVQ